MISFVVNLMEGQSNLNELLKFLAPRDIHQSLCCIVDGNMSLFLYGHSATGLIFDFTPQECLVWMSDTNRVGHESYELVANREKIDNYLVRAKDVQMSGTDADIAFNIICRLVGVVSEKRKKDRLTSDDLDKGLLDLGRQVPGSGGR